MRIIELNKSVTESNDRDAEELRAELRNRGICLINLMSSPGSGKTTLISRLIRDMNDEVPIAVCEADIDSAVDAERIESLGAVAVQVHTDGMCHMDAGMTRRGLLGMDLTGIRLAFLENVGNLVCPAEFDVGANLRVMILSVPEGDDKPLKYPLMFSVSDLMLINKIDVAPIFDFDYDACVKRAKKLNPDIEVIRMSSLTGDGFDDWIHWLTDKVDSWRHKNASN